MRTREARLDNAVRQVFGLYESEKAYGMAKLHRVYNLLQMRLRRQTIYDDMDYRLLARTMHEVRRAYHAQ